ncbi:class I SAM-dependent methyltransferase [Nocardiopsis trehalosi]|uniref:class I SAM-dependent methyltransferase n=1 Tax=Nocardiopsis trehalosi TaxID=109329 RepID=UPI00082FA337|nr:class I SAM-dependent methyltransferase [Nocardiopsis trehalosi]
MTAPAGLAERVQAAAEAAVPADRVAAAPAHLRRMDEAALLAMARTLRTGGLFRGTAAHTAEEVAEATGTAPRHRWILRRWLAALVREGLLEQGADGRYRGLRRVSPAELRAAADGLEEAGRHLDYPAELLGFLRGALGSLPALLRDDLAVQALLFAGGETGAADGAYRDNAVNRYVNAAVAAVALRAAEERAPRPLRVLEIGAGVGGTTADVLAALAGRPVDYLFTDVSRYFLDAGRERFGAVPGVGFAMLDANADPLGGGVPGAGGRDVVVAANVLHNAHDLDRCLRGVRDLLVPGGRLLCVDTVRELYPILTSMQFLMSAPPGGRRPGDGDARAGTDHIFLSRAEWGAALRRTGFAPELEAPEADHPLAAAAVTLFAARRCG